jgi:predicted RNA-binding Zn ribbon-like protein
MSTYEEGTVLNDLWMELLNSEWRDWRGGGRSEDRLDKPGWLQTLLETRGFVIQGEQLPDQLASWKELRGLIHKMLVQLLEGELPSDSDISSLNAFMAQGNVTRQLIRDENNYLLKEVPIRQDVAFAMAAFAVSFTQTWTQGHIDRVRICENQDCLWVYFDDTRNHSKKYCDDKMCGNLMKVRRFRAKKKALASSGES